MIKEALQYLVSLKENKTYEINGDVYSEKELVRIPPYVARPARISVTGLDSIVKLVRNELDTRLKACRARPAASTSRTTAYGSRRLNRKEPQGGGGGAIPRPAPIFERGRRHAEHQRGHRAGGPGAPGRLR